MSYLQALTADMTEGCIGLSNRKLLDFFIQTTGLPVPTLLLCFNVNDLHSFAMVLINN